MDDADMENHLIEVTPHHLRCGIGACPAIFQTGDGRFIVIGEIIDAADPRWSGPLSGRIGAREAAVALPKEFILSLAQRSGEK